MLLTRSAVISQTRNVVSFEPNIIPNKWLIIKTIMEQEYIEIAFLKLFYFVKEHTWEGQGERVREKIPGRLL